MRTFNTQTMKKLARGETSKYLDVPNEMQEYLESLPDDITLLDLSNRNLTKLPNISRFIKLEILYCNNNQITQLDNLPNTLKILFCYSNQITQLDNLPNSLQSLDCSYDQITQLDNLPNSLKELYCSNNQITQLDNLPNSLQKLYCYDNEITQLDHLPNLLQTLFCYNNELPSYDLEYWKQKTFERKLNEFNQKRAVKIIKRNWLRFWYEPYRYEDIDGELIGISRYMEYGYKNCQILLNKTD